ncbi:hypothetical protein B566_EDAN016007, partial [Ephemera danica]
MDTAPGDDEAPKDPGIQQPLYAGYTEKDFEVTPPAQRVQFILGEDEDGSGHETHPLFSEMGELVRGEGDDLEWK